MAREREEQLMAAAASSSSRFTATKTSYADTEQPKLPFVFDALAEARGRGGFSGARKMALPEGTATGHKDDWDFFEFPIPKKDTLDFLNVPVIEISQLDRIGRIAFEGVERLNPIQSIVFDAAYNSSENLLICAPTGAGKTNTAMLTVVRLIREHLNEDFVLDLKSFKVVYMAPMKALAAEMTATFSKRLNPLGIKVRECTGDMQLSKQEIMDTQMLVTTPEKWDVISRKGAGDASLVQALKLLIIDEVHLLHEDRGAVIEALVARTLRQAGVEVSQSMIRIVGLSATLPNYVDVAQFLRVNLNRGLFYFDSRFRPVPLGMSFLGVTPPNRHSQEEAMNEACYQKVIEQLLAVMSFREIDTAPLQLVVLCVLLQVMVFVHARGETSKTARWIRDAATQRGDMAHFQPLAANTVDLFKRVPHCHDATVRELAVQGIACHHAGMLRPDRRLVEQLFSNRVIRVLVCTATLAWGVNLPAHAVIIKGTKIYDADKSDFVDLDILDVVQIFGRAGRPQFDTFGLATIITTRDKLDHYVRLITNQVAIESKLLSNINDHLNAEDDPDFTHFMTSALRAAALELDRAEMVRYEESTGQLASTDRGRTASLYYIKYETAALVKDALHPLMLIADLFALISQAHEFSSMKVRDEEEGDLLDLEDNVCHVPVKNPGTVDSSVRKKINVLLQAYISRQQPRTHSLISDMNYIQQNAGRLARYIFEIAVRRGWAVVASNAHRLSKMIERQMWYDESPLWQLTISGKSRLLERVDIMGLTVDRIRELGPNELKDILRYEGKNGAQTVFEMAQSMPVLRMLALSGEPAELVFTIPVHDPIPPQYLVRCMPDRWLGAESVVPVILRNILLPQTDPPHTDLLNLTPLPVTALKNPQYEGIFNFTHFNPIQTQIFHSLYHQDVNILLGSPTGSGKTVAAELAILRVFNTAPHKKCIYIAPLKALVRERVDDWSVKIGQKLGKRVVELTGDVTPDIGILRRADVIVTTPEKWDGISRMWRQRAYVRDIALIIIDEIHMVGEERGPVLEPSVDMLHLLMTKEQDQLAEEHGLTGSDSSTAHWVADCQQLPYQVNYRPTLCLLCLLEAIFRIRVVPTEIFAARRSLAPKCTNFLA
ncbi:unnamed protein product [Schistocephalus solidus]|uniref:Activating signal cointegrator 1 complex subunit 3 n=1 Tax=Schistocephalus solidus TaxID=70667 RepID=A0A3P7CYT3_SCHSO|nr:unnamed protein product [Schistocephalus solidus]